MLMHVRTHLDEKIVKTLKQKYESIRLLCYLIYVHLSINPRIYAKQSKQS